MKLVFGLQNSSGKLTKSLAVKNQEKVYEKKKGKEQKLTTGSVKQTRSYTAQTADFNKSKLQSIAYGF